MRILERHRPRRVAVCDRGDDRAMGAVGLGRCARQHVVERAVGLGRVPEDVEQPRLGPAAGERVEPVVEAPVRGELAGDVAGSGCLGAVVGGSLERAQVGGRRPFDAEQQRIVSRRRRRR